MVQEVVGGLSEGVLGAEAPHSAPVGKEIGGG